MGSFCNSKKCGPKCKPAKIHISPKWGAIPPEQKIFLSGSLGPNSPRVRRGKGAPKGANSKKCHAPKNFEPHFLEKKSTDFFLNFRGQRGPQYLSFNTFKRKSVDRIFRKMKKQKFSFWGAWPPNLTPDTHVPRNLSRAHLGAHDPEKISEMRQRVAEKIEFKKKILAPPGGQTGSGRGHVTI